MLNTGGITVATLDTVLATLRDPAADARQAFFLPPASSLALLRAQNANATQAATQGQPKAPPNDADALAAAARSIAGDGEATGLFDD